MSYHKKRKTDWPRRELIPEDSMKAAGAAVLDVKPVNAVARESGVTHTTLNSTIRAYVQIFTDSTSSTIRNKCMTTDSLMQWRSKVLGGPCVEIWWRALELVFGLKQNKMCAFKIILFVMCIYRTSVTVV